MVATNPLSKILDVKEEEDKEIIDSLRALSNKNEIFLTIIAPYVGVKISPSKEITASMGITEEFGVETVIEKIKDCGPNCDKLYLLLNSPGGLVQSSYKVARALRNNFKEIIVFVPHIAASGGTLISLTGNKIVMGMMSQLTPLDPHSNGISALSVIRSFENVTDWFSNLAVEDAPYTYKVLADKFNGPQVDLALSSLELLKKYINEILKESGYEKGEIDQISKKMVEGFLTHNDVINIDVAKEIGLKVVDYTEYQDLWEVLRRWLGNYIVKSADKHIIRYWINNKGEEIIENNKED